MYLQCIYVPAVYKSFMALVHIFSLRQTSVLKKKLFQYHLPLLCSKIALMHKIHVYYRIENWAIKIGWKSYIGDLINQSPSSLSWLLYAFTSTKCNFSHLPNGPPTSIKSFSMIMLNYSTCAYCACDRTFQNMTRVCSLDHLHLLHSKISELDYFVLLAQQNLTGKSYLNWISNLLF